MKKFWKLSMYALMFSLAATTMTGCLSFDGDDDDDDKVVVAGDAT